MKQAIAVTILTTFVAGALAFNIKEKPTRFTKETISVGLVVDDFEESIKFYTEVIGMQKTGGFSIDEEFGKTSGLSGGVPFDVAILKLANSESASEWKIVSFDDPPKAQKNEHIQDHLGMQYITIFVDSVEPYRQRLSQNGVKLLGDTELGDGRKFLLFTDPNGIFIEIIGG